MKLQSGKKIIIPSLCERQKKHIWNKISKTGKFNQFSFHPHRKQANEARKVLRVPANNYIWCCILSIVVLLFDCTTSQTLDQEVRPFPPLFNAAQNRPIFTEPSYSTCGVNTRSAYCKSFDSPLSVQTCSQDFCIQTCPGRTHMPTPHSLLPPTGGFSDCVVADRINRRNGSDSTSYATSFIGEGQMCFLTPSVDVTLGSRQEYSFTVWIWPERDNDG